MYNKCIDTYLSEQKRHLHFSLGFLLRQISTTTTTIIQHPTIHAAITATIMITLALPIFKLKRPCTSSSQGKPTPIVLLAWQ